MVQEIPEAGAVPTTALDPVAPAEKDVPYGPAALQKLDIYTPAKPNGAAIIDIHGGGWVQGDKAKEVAIATTFAAAGYLVAAVNYRLADGPDAVRYPAQINDIETVWEWLMCCGYEFDRSRVGAFGASSGGNLAVELAARHGAPAAAWSGLLDLEGFMAIHQSTTPVRANINTNTASDHIDQGGANDEYYKWLVLNLLDGEEDKLHDATVLHRITSKCGPLLVAASTNELVPVHEVLKVASAMIDANRPVQTLIVPGIAHGEGYLDAALAPTLDFFAYHLVTNPEN
jgi:acetyl esterase/lipase